MLGPNRRTLQRVRKPKAHTRNRRLARALVLAAAAGGAIVPVPTRAQVEVVGGPSYDHATGNGYYVGNFPLAYGIYVNDAGTGIGYAYRYVSNSPKDLLGVMWDASGNALELANLGADASGVTQTSAYGINASSLIAGSAQKFVSGSSKGIRAVRWDASGNALELGNLGTSASGVTSSSARAINASGQTAGSAWKYVSGIEKGSRAVRWDASGNALELGNLGTNASGDTSAIAEVINASGMTAGYATKYVSGIGKGSRGVLWDVSGNALELGNLGTDIVGSTDSSVRAINDSGLTAGAARKYVSGSEKGLRPVLWDVSGNVVELANLGTDASDSTFGSVFAINATGQTAGYAQKYVSGIAKGNRAVRWDTSGNALELENLDVDPTGVTGSGAHAINASGLTAGHASKYVADGNFVTRAAYWKADGSIVDLNTLISPTAGWSLTSAHGISDSGWVVGSGTFDVDGDGPLIAYKRLFSLNIGTTNSWINAAGGNWNDGDNWSHNFAPSASVDAIFDGNSSYTVTLDADAFTQKFYVTNDSVDLNLAGRRLTTGHLSGTAVNIGANGRLYLGNGTFQTTLGAMTVPGADIQVDGGGKLTLSSGTLLVGGALAIGANGTGTGSMIINGGTTNVGTEAGTDHTLYVGSNTAGIVLQSAGTVSVAGSARIGNTSISAGTYTMTGGMLHVGANLLIGGSTSNGTMSISGTGAVTATNSTTVQSGGKLILSGGSLKTGSLDFGGISTRLDWNSGTLELTASGLDVGTGKLFGNLITLPAEKAMIVSGNIVVGSVSTGTIDISGGWLQSKAPIGGLVVGYTGRTGVGTLSAGAIVTTFDFDIGNNATGSFTQSGGFVSIGHTFAVGNSGGTGTALLSGGSLSGANITVGNGGSSGTLAISETAAVTATNSTTVQAGGKLMISGGSLKTGSLALGGVSTRLIWTGGKLEFTGGTSNVGALTIPASGTLKGTGTISGSVAVTSNGTISPGNSAGILRANSLTASSQTILDIELGGQTAGSGHDQLALSGAAALDGTMKITLLPTFSPVGTHFDVLTFGSRTGDVTLDLQSYPGLILTKSYSATKLTLNASPMYPGDANLDAFVDIRDLVTLATHFNASGQGWFNGDFSGDGLVNATDLAVLAENWQAGVGAAAGPTFAEALTSVQWGNTSVPEPGMCVILLGTLLVAPRRRRM